MEQYDVRCIACGKVIDIHDARILDLMDEVQKLKRKVEMLETSIPTPPENKEQKERGNYAEK